LDSHVGSGIVLFLALFVAWTQHGCAPMPVHGVREGCRARIMCMSASGVRVERELSNPSYTIAGGCVVEVVDLDRDYRASFMPGAPCWIEELPLNPASEPAQ
jgi:hypothetical protein